MRTERPQKPRPPLDSDALDRLGLHYVGRYGTTKAKLKAYLARKVKERGWAGEGTAPLDALAERFCQLGYIDDSLFATARAASLQRRGFGERRVAEALRAAGVASVDSEQAREQARDGAWPAALRFAERKRLGPYAAQPHDREARRKAFAAMMRAGHPTDIVRRVLDAPPGVIPDSDSG